jgi:hypothetical protein
MFSRENDLKSSVGGRKQLLFLIDHEELSDHAQTAPAVWERACPRSSRGGDQTLHRGPARSHNAVWLRIQCF